MSNASVYSLNPTSGQSKEIAPAVPGLDAIYTVAKGDLPGPAIDKLIKAGDGDNAQSKKTALYILFFELKALTPEMLASVCRSFSIELPVNPNQNENKNASEQFISTERAINSNDPQHATLQFVLDFLVKAVNVGVLDEERLGMMKEQLEAFLALHDTKFDLTTLMSKVTNVIKGAALSAKATAANSPSTTAPVTTAFRTTGAPMTSATKPGEAMPSSAFVPKGP